MSRALLAVAAASALGCSARTPAPAETGTADPPAPVALRVATFNVSLFRDGPGVLARELAEGDDSPAAIAAAILQIVRPDIVLLNEFDHDADGAAVDAFRRRFLAVSQDGRDPLDLPHAWIPEVNTGVPSGVDLDGDGRSDHVPGSQEYGNDALGFGTHPGQYGMVVLSRFPIAGARTFRRTLWRDMPGTLLPTDFYSPEAQAVLPLSSKTHGDVAIDVDGRPLHLLVSHPTPPTFDGPEDRNGRRNHDEIRFWIDHLDGADWIVDDDGTPGGLGDAPFVILGDLNSDPADGDSRREAIVNLLAHPRTTDAAPASPGAEAQAVDPADAAQQGPARLDTADFGPSVGNLRVDHAIPSSDLTLRGSGVFWPAPTDPDFALVGTFPFPLTDHRLVWVDVTLR